MRRACRSTWSGFGRATFIPERHLKSRLTLLIEANFPELFTEPLYVPLGEAEHDAGGAEREVAGVRRIETTDALGAAEAALEMMERLTFNMPPTRPGGTSGADVKRAMRLYFAGAISTRDAKAAWEAEPVELHGERALTIESLLECMPGGAQLESRAATHRRLEALRTAFACPSSASLPRSHVTVSALRSRYWDLWAEACEDLAAPAQGLAFHWFVDLLFAEVGRDTPFASFDAEALALQDLEAARAAAAAAARALRKKTRDAGFARLIAVFRLSSLREPDEVVARRLAIASNEAIRLRVAASTIIDKVWTERRLLPNQQALAEERLLSDLATLDGDIAPEGDRP